MNNLMCLIAQSWADKQGNVNTSKEILDWVERLNSTVQVDIRKIALKDSMPWFYDAQEGAIVNQGRSFFQIYGLRRTTETQVQLEQPVIFQDEIGYLGLICKNIKGTLNFLIQAKIEPGNINKIQLSPTIQATKSNFTQKHGGKKTAYLDYFMQANHYRIIVDQVQSEQSSRFYKKRNRNIIIMVDEEIEVLPSHKWMTLGQIKQFMKIDNLVNMDTRTVLSCIPFSMYPVDEEQHAIVKSLFMDKSLYRSFFHSPQKNQLPDIYHYLNDYKMFDETITELVPLFSLKRWQMCDNEFCCLDGYNFKVVFCNISIEGREVLNWTQPLFEASGIATFALIMREEDGVKQFLVRARPEVGCFDKLELGPSVQLEPTFQKEKADMVEKVFLDAIESGLCHIKNNVLLSEEGGRFYHEQNRNIILEIDCDEIRKPPEGYFWIDYRTLNLLTQINNCLNIQLRNLLSILEV